MAVVRRNILNSPHAQRYADGVIRLAGMQSGITPNQLNGSSIVQRAPGARMSNSTRSSTKATGRAERPLSFRR